MEGAEVKGLQDKQGQQVLQAQRVIREIQMVLLGQQGVKVESARQVVKGLQVLLELPVLSVQQGFKG
jgi:hypothetical protein